MEGQRQAIEALLEERRVFPPPAAFRERARVSDESLYAEAEADPVGFWMSRALSEPDLVPRADAGARRLQPAVLQVVRRRRAERLRQLPRPAPRGRRRRQDRLHLGRRARRRARDQLPRAARRGQPPRERAARPRRRRRATASRSTSAWCPSCRWRCWPARASARRTRSIFGGFSAQSLAGRINDAECKVLITADGGWRKGGDRAAQGGRRRRARATARRSSTCSSCAAPSTRSTGSRAATTGTTTSSRRRPTGASPSA